MFREKFLTLWSKIKANLLAAVLGGVGILFLIIGVVSIFLPQSKENSLIFESKEASPSSKIIVDIEGAVVSPGIYQLNLEARLQDGLIAAGGLSNEADREWIARNLNLAVKLKDGSKVYIPLKTEAGSRKLEVGAGNGKVESLISGLINVNTATLSELDKLPGVGPVTAQKIVNNRPYADVDELLTKKVVGQKVFGEIKEKITTY